MNTSAKSSRWYIEAPSSHVFSQQQPFVIRGTDWLKHILWVFGASVSFWSWGWSPNTSSITTPTLIILPSFPLKSLQYFNIYCDGLRRDPPEPTVRMHRNCKKGITPLHPINRNQFTEINDLRHRSYKIIRLLQMLHGTTELAILSHSCSYNLHRYNLLADKQIRPFRGFCIL